MHGDGDVLRRKWLKAADAGVADVMKDLQAMALDIIALVGMGCDLNSLEGSYS